jgi:hypothetical protein
VRREEGSRREASPTRSYLIVADSALLISSTAFHDPSACLRKNGDKAALLGCHLLARWIGGSEHIGSTGVAEIAAPGDFHLDRLQCERPVRIGHGILHPLANRFTGRIPRRVAVNIEQLTTGRICYLSGGGSASASVYPKFEPTLPLQQRTSRYNDAVWK